MYVADNAHVVLDFLEYSLNGYILVGHYKLAVLYLDAASDDLPLLEAVAGLALSGKGYLGACDSGARSCESFFAVLVLENDYLVLCGEYGLNFNILVGHDELVVLYFYLALYDLPLLESIAFLGGSGEGYLFAVDSRCLIGGSGAVAVGCNLDAALLGEDNLNNNILVGHDELVAGDCDIALNDLPACEEIAAVGLCGKNYLSAGNSSLGVGISLTHLGGLYGDAVLGKLLENSDNLNVCVGHGELVAILNNRSLAENLPLLELVAFVGLSFKGYLGACDSSFCGCGCSAVLSLNGDCVCNGINFGLIGICGDCENQSEQHEAAKQHA